jgi:ribose transport system permease protein
MTVESPAVRTSLRDRFRRTDQGVTVGALLVVIAAVAALTLDRFGTAENLLNIGRSTATLGILGIGMTVVVIARGLDLSIVAIMSVSAVLTVQMIRDGSPEPVAIPVAALLAVLLGAVNGLLVAYVKIPPLFVTLATALLFFGVGRIVYLHDQIVTVPPEAGFLAWLGGGEILGIPNPVILFAAVAVGVAILLSRNVGRYLYALGDNPEAGRLAGLPYRPLTVFSYVVSGLLGFVGGLTLVAVAGSFDFRILTAGTLLYDVVAVVVIGGVSLAGGRGTIFGVTCAALLVGLIGNIMTLLDFDTIQQSLAKAIVVLLAIVVDGVLHPRDEETARVGDL